MKTKPDIRSFTSPSKDQNEFLESGAADRAEKPTPGIVSSNETTPAVDVAPRYGRARVQKIFNFPEELADRLRDEALVRSKASGSRVTEKDIVVEALRAFLNHK